MAFRTRDGVKLSFEETGHGKAVVLIHGWTCDRSYFAPQRDHLARTHRVVSVDLRGHGESDKPQGPYTIAGFADDVAWLCQDLGLVKPIVIGHSMGGMTALEVAARHPDLPRAIVACDSPMAVPEPLASNLGAISADFHKPDWRSGTPGLSVRSAVHRQRRSCAQSAHPRRHDLGAGPRDARLLGRHRRRGHGGGATQVQGAVSLSCRRRSARRLRALARALSSHRDRPDRRSRTFSSARGSRSSQRDDRSVYRAPVAFPLNSTLQPEVRLMDLFDAAGVERSGIVTEKAPEVVVSLLWFRDCYEAIPRKRRNALADSSGRSTIGMWPTSSITTTSACGSTDLRTSAPDTSTRRS